MFQTNLNSRLVLAVTAVTLSLTFLGDPSIPVRIRDLKELEKPFANGKYTHEDQFDEILRDFFLRKSETDGWHTFTYYIGLVAAWPIADRYGRKRGILYCNFFRFLAVIFHFTALLSPNYYTSTIPVVSTVTTSDCSNTTTTTTVLNKTVNAALVSFSLYGKLSDGLFSGLTTVLGMLYVYEISPKSPSSTKVGSLSIMAFYMFLKNGADYAVVMLLPPLKYVTVNVWVWIISGVLTIIAGALQMILLLDYCPEPPSYLAIQGRNPARARTALIKLRGTNDVMTELEIIQRNEEVRESLKRSMFLVSLYLVFALYNGLFLFMGFAHGMEIGINLVTSVNTYLLANILSFLIPLFCFGNLPLKQVKEILFSYYFLLGTLYFLLTTLLSVNMYLAPSIFESNEIAAGIFVAISCVTQVAYSSGPGLLTTILVMEYANQADRTKNFILSWISGIIVTSKAVAFFSLIFIKALFLYYLVFQTFPWIFLFCITWFVWKFETMGYGARLAVDGNANFQADRNASKKIEAETSHA